MIREDFVKPQTAKLLKSLGFDGEQIGNNPPTLQIVAKWLRHTHGISVEPISTKTCGIHRCYRVFVNSDTTIEHADFKTYEEAFGFGINYALNLLREGGVK